MAQTTAANPEPQPDAAPPPDIHQMQHGLLGDLVFSIAHLADVIPMASGLVPHVQRMKGSLENLRVALEKPE